MKKKPTVSKLKKKLDIIFSQYVRVKNMNEDELVKCFTCDSVRHYKKMHNGHFQVRQHMATRFDELNCQPQCPSCNTFHEGEQFKFAQELDKKFGRGVAQELQTRAMTTVKLDVHWYEQMIEKYRTKLVDLL